jgi:phospholipid transport system substrate-binding protein
MSISRSLLLGSLLLAAFARTAAADPAAAPAVERLHAALLGVMKEADALGYAGRAERLRPVLADVYDVAFMARRSIGSQWDALGEDQRRAFVETFGRFTVASYASNFDGFSGQSFHTDAEEASIQATQLVRTRLVRPGDTDVHLDYRLHRDGERWRIIDVYYDGTVSELARRRAEYSAVIKRDGFDALIAAIDRKIADLEKPKD